MTLFLGVDAGDAFFTEDAFASGLDLGFIVGMGISHDLAELGMMIKRFARGVKFEPGALQGETFTSESEVFIGDADILRFVLIRFLFGDPTAEFLEGLQIDG